jgi:hypothetical protein
LIEARIEAAREFDAAAAAFERAYARHTALGDELTTNPVLAGQFNWSFRTVAEAVTGPNRVVAALPDCLKTLLLRHPIAIAVPHASLERTEGEALDALVQVAQRAVKAAEAHG